MNESPAESPQRKQRISTLVWQLAAAVLAITIIILLVIWQPWRPTADRTVQVVGRATVQAVPDEFVFSPVYQFKNANLQAALSDLTKKSDEVVAKLKSLGVRDDAIKTNSSSYSYPQYLDGSGTPTYSLTLTVTLDNQDLAQKVQNYLLTTSPAGAVSPQADFSTKKRKEVEARARDQAATDARNKADVSARNLGFSVGAVKSVTDGTGFGTILPLTNAKGSGANDATAELSLQPGQNNLSYSVTVVYFIR